MNILKRFARALGMPGVWFWLGLALVWTCLVSVGQVLDARSLVGAFDTGLYLQLLYNLHEMGRFSSSVTGEANFLGHHFQPVIALLSPFAEFSLRAFHLFCVGLVMSILAAIFLLRAEDKERRDACFYGIAFMVLTHPSIVSRLWYGFSPDVLALPAFCWMAAALCRREHALGKWLVALVWAGLCKETFWLTNCAVAGVVAWHTRWTLRWSVVALAQFAMFLFLFLLWMPAHSTLPSYYGLSYYFSKPDAGSPLLAMVMELVQNVASLQSLTSFAWLVSLTLGLPFLRWTAPLVAALPGLGLILVSRSPLVHHPANHYLISVLPFLAASAMQNRKFLETKFRPYSCPRSPWFYSLALLPVLYTVFHVGGPFDALRLVAQNPQTQFREESLSAIRTMLPREARLMVDVNLQPRFFDFPNTEILLGFSGSPRRLADRDLQTIQFVVTEVDLRRVTDCRKVQVGGLGMEVDYPYFWKICGWIQANATLLAEFPKSGIVVYKMNTNP